MLTENKIKQLSPKAAAYLAGLNEAATRYDISSPQRMAAFLAQVAHESGGFRTAIEGLNYSAEALRKTFPRYFPNEAMAEQYARQPEKIANRVYASRLGNGSESSGDGWKYRGHGLIQTTGKNNIEAFSRHYYGDARLLRDPAPLSRDPLAGISAGYFWHANKLNAYADQGRFQAICAIVNTGNPDTPPKRINGYDDRVEWWQRAKRVMGAT